ncbi:hypothetical protein FACS189468_8740 [Spirochaetia bacterium]|nr:hypothetical protein FACS189468_8740 [Spirochaetia bacterium]
MFLKKILSILAIIIFTNIGLFSQEITEIYELDTYNFIAGPSYGYSGRESSQWKLYKIIKEKYSSEIIENNYYRSESIIAKIYLYWILREREWDDLSNIYDDLMKYKNIKFIFAPGGCIIFSEPIDVERIIKYDYNHEYENTEISENNNLMELLVMPKLPLLDEVNKLLE